MPPSHHKIIVTQEQLSTLVEFMERHGDLSINPKGTRIKFLWAELVGILNQIGVGPRKTLEQWKKSWTDLKYRTKEKALKIQEASGAVRSNTIGLTQLEKRICEIIKSSRSYLEEPNEESPITENIKDCQEPEETEDPMFIEFIEHSESLSPVLKSDNSPSSSPPPLLDTGLKMKRKRRNSYEDLSESSYKRKSSTSLNNTTNNLRLNIEEENKLLHHRQLIELKRLELETLRETNLHEREKERAQIEREKFRQTIKLQQQLISLLQDIKPALITFLNK